MLTLDQRSTDVTQDAMLSVEIVERLNAFEGEIRADGKVFNPLFMWKTARELQRDGINGDTFVLALTLASMTRRPGQGCRVTHAVIGRRAAVLKRMFRLADQVGWPRILAVIDIRG